MPLFSLVDYGVVPASSAGPFPSTPFQTVVAVSRTRLNDDLLDVACVTSHIRRNRAVHRMSPRLSMPSPYPTNSGRTWRTPIVGQPSCRALAEELLAVSGMPSRLARRRLTKAPKTHRCISIWHHRQAGSAGRSRQMGGQRSAGFYRPIHRQLETVQSHRHRRRRSGRVARQTPRSCMTSSKATAFPTLSRSIRVRTPALLRSGSKTS